MTVQSKSPEQIEDEIRTTRRDIDRTLDALQTRLSPGQLLDQALGYVKSGGGEFATNFGRTIAQNPIPVTLLGIGCAWLMWSRPHDRIGAQAGDGRFAEMSDWDRATETEATGFAPEESRGWDTEAGDRAHGAGETAREYVQSAGGTAREYAHAAGDTARRYRHRAGVYAHSAREQGTRASQATKQAVNDYPLVAGAVGLAIGAIAAALLPSTRREDEIMGAAADSLKRAARGVAGEQADKLRDVTQSAADAAADEAKRQGLTEESGAAPDRMDVSPSEKRTGGELRW